MPETLILFVTQTEMPWCQAYFGTVQVFEGDLVPELGRLAAVLLELLEVLKRHRAACFAKMYLAGRAGQLFLTKRTDSNLAVSEENPVHAVGRAPRWGCVGLLEGFLVDQALATSIVAFLACHTLGQYLSDYG